MPILLSILKELNQMPLSLKEKRALLVIRLTEKNLLGIADDVQYMSEFRLRKYVLYASQTLTGQA